MPMPMPTTLTLRGIPDDVDEHLKMSAQANRRSLNGEAIACLQSVLLPRKAAGLQHAARARSIRGALEQGTFTVEDIDKFKRTGRQ